MTTHPHLTAASLISFGTIQYILSYLGKELYDETRDTVDGVTIQIRFIPRIFKTTLGYLFQKTRDYPMHECYEAYYDEVTSRTMHRMTQTRIMQIRRPNSLLDIIYTVCESGEKINEITCTFKYCDDPAQITTYKYGISRYRFYKKHLIET